ncbi:MAG: GHKL domain-containing protein [Gammaproteobacteria bacterium]|nr:GHKL domain-containing protein [Gammaproteobacteria bacterium]
MTLSLHTRVIAAAAIVMVSFFGIAGGTLQSIYYHDLLTALQDRLQSDAYVLIAASELDDNGALNILFPLPDTRFLATHSTVYAQIIGNEKRQTWQSASLARTSIPFPQNLTTAERSFEQLQTSDGQAVYVFSLGVALQGSSATQNIFTVSVATDLRDFTRRIARFKRSLWIWLGGVTALLLVVQSIILRWGLTPLTRVASELRAIEKGQRSSLGGDYPRELHALTENINTLIRNRQEHIERYRNTLSDLAHSLNTPLAVLRGISETKSDLNASAETLREQVEYMSSIVAYQLQKAAASGSGALTAPVAIQPIAIKIVNTLNKVYAEKNVQCTVDIEAGTIFHGDVGDLMELLGNLLDNAFKWSTRRVQLHAAMSTHPENPILNLSIDDDGPGIPANMIDRVMDRGVRADLSTSGHGIGLAVVRDIVKLYSGTLVISQNSNGGAHVAVTLHTM